MVVGGSGGQIWVTKVSSFAKQTVFNAYIVPKVSPTRQTVRSNPKPTRAKQKPRVQAMQRAL